jgi:hypothetical protein
MRQSGSGIAWQGFSQVRLSRLTCHPASVALSSQFNLMRHVRSERLPCRVLGDKCPSVPREHYSGRQITTLCSRAARRPAAARPTPESAGARLDRAEDGGSPTDRGVARLRCRSHVASIVRRWDLRGPRDDAVHLFRGAQGCTRITVLPLRRSAGLSAGTASSRVATVPMCVRRRPSRARSAISAS